MSAEREVLTKAADKSAPKAEPREVTRGSSPAQEGHHARILQLQGTLGNRRVGELIRSQSIARDGRLVPVHRRSTGSATGPALVSSSKSQQDSESIAGPEEAAMTETSRKSVSLSPADGPPAPKVHVQRAWYNFDIPFTNYQFDPSLQGIKNAANVVKDTAEAALDAVVDEVKSVVTSGAEWLREQWNSVEEFATSSLQTAQKALGNILNMVKNPLGALGDAVTALDEKSIAKAWSTFSGFITTTADSFKAMTDGVLDKVNQLWGGINSFATGLLSRVDGLTNNVLFKKLPAVLQGLAASLVTQLKSLWKSINDGWTALFNKVKAWIDRAIDQVTSFVRRVASFGINVLIAGIADIGKVVLLLKDLFANPQKYVELLAKPSVQAFDGVEGRFAGVISQHFGGAKAAQPAGAGPKVQRAPQATAEAKRSAGAGEIGQGISQTMLKKWNEFKANPMAIVKGLLMDMIFPLLGDAKDIIQLFKDIKKIVTGPLSADSLEDLWTSLLQLVGIPLAIYHTVVSILMRTLMIPLIVATFVPHPVVKAIAAAVGYGLLGSFVQAELFNIGQKMLLLTTGATIQSQKEDAYNSISDSLIAMAMTAVIMIVMLILHFIANVMKGIFNFVKGKVFPIETGPAEGKGATPGEGESKSGDTKGLEPGEIEEQSLDGKRKVRTTADGKCEVCASPCDKLRVKYGEEIGKNPKIEERINEIESSEDSKSNKEKQYRQVEQDLANIRRVNRLAQDIHDLYGDELADPDNEAIKGRLEEAEKIPDLDAREKALQQVQKELADARHPDKAGAYHGPKPRYTNPGTHDPSSPNFRGGGDLTTLLPPDAEAVYKTSVPDEAVRNWYGRNADGEFYRYAPNGGNDNGVHWNGRQVSGRGLQVPPEVRARFQGR